MYHAADAHLLLALPAQTLKCAKSYLPSPAPSFFHGHATATSMLAAHSPLPRSYAAAVWLIAWLSPSDPSTVSRLS